MPLYDYQCKRCGETSEFAHVADRDNQRCPKCKRKLKRLVSKRVLVQYKGMGFHSTDYTKHPVL